MFIYRNKCFKNATEALDDYIRNFCLENFEHGFSNTITKEINTNNNNNKTNIYLSNHNNNNNNKQKYYPSSILKNSKKTEVLEATLNVITEQISLPNHFDKFKLDCFEKEKKPTENIEVNSNDHFDDCGLDKILNEIKNALS